MNDVGGRFDRTFDLGIDTAGDDASLVLVASDGRVVAERAWRTETNMTRELLAQLDALLVEAGATRQAIARIAVNVGPGQYGALRAGIATAQGLAIALDASVASVGRLEADAALVLSEARPVVVAVHDARGSVAWGAYALDGAGTPREIEAPRMSTVVEAVALAPVGATWTGENTDALRAALAARRDADARNSDTSEAGPSEVQPSTGGTGETRAAAVVRIARARDAYGDPGLVDAIYLRPPPITPPRQQ